MIRRCRDDVAAIAADVQSRPKLARRVSDFLAWMAEEVVKTAAASDREGRSGKFSVLRLELLQALFAALVDVDVQHDEIGARTGDDSDIRMRPLSPPRLDPLEVRRGVLQSFARSRMFAGTRAVLALPARAPAGRVDAVDGKDVPAACDVLARPHERICIRVRADRM
jgi:hypothetical protein